MDKNNVASSIGALVGTQSTAAQVMARYRATAKEYGRFFGEQIYTVVATNPDLKWKEDVLNDKNTLRKEVNVFIVKAIDILDVKFIAKDLDGEPKIMLNPDDNDPNLVFPLVKPDFSKADRKSVAECIERIGKKNSKPMFFAAEELPMLNDMLKIHNKGILNFYEDLSRKFIRLSETVRDMMDQSDRMQLEYQRQCGVVTDETEVTLQVNLEETTE
ncbi:MAG: hypothetical protein ACLUUE_00360 [Romboutsia timonensis]|jgi:hypothetical protein|nr:MAG: hypothetical protein [Bacteriophage sp.]DAG92700.1 MAG TPA: hypothetical protein [Crassvirales sp.]DAU06223.1 MAG TPA: hypothetical protein [Caudoviricetes sp.]UWG79527.1 MAG: hypothetical protein [Bacteriophage sp.]UWI01330.1 MAG: hypothetical protein [Bacteriophage sp.]